MISAEAHFVIGAVSEIDLCKRIDSIAYKDRHNPCLELRHNQFSTVYDTHYFFVC